MKNIIKITLISSALIFCIFSSIFCNKLKSDTKPDEGVITYEITYLDSERENPIIALLPKEMIVKFKDNKTATIIEGFMGFFEMTFVTDKNKSFTLLKIMGNKYYSEIDSNSLNFGYEKMQGLTVKKINETKLISGFKCNRAQIVCDSISSEPFNVYYTNDISIKNPNAASPYSGIEGVLMNFKVNLNNINMSMNATKVVSEDIDDAVFSIPQEYKKVDKSEMIKLITGFSK